MTKQTPRKEMAEQERRRADDPTERRFNETVRNLLNTPPKPHKAGNATPKRPPKKRDQRPLGDADG